MPSVDMRRISIDEVDTVAEFAIRGLRPERYPLHVSEARVRAAIRHFATSQTDFHLAAFDGPRMVGGIAVLVSPILWFERTEAHVVMFFCDPPGAGAALLRAAMQWAKRNPAIRRVLWPLEDDADAQRMQRFARRFGFDRSQHVMLAYKE